MFCCACRIRSARLCALALVVAVGSICAPDSYAQDMLVNGGAVPAPYGPPPLDVNPYELPAGQPMAQPAPSDTWIAPPGAQPQMVGPTPCYPCTGAPDWGQPVIAEPPGEIWSWHVMPR